MLPTGRRKPAAATCEEWDEDAQTTLPDTRTSANVAAKRSKPELNSSSSHRSRTQEGTVDKMSRPAASTKADGSVKKEKRRPDGLKLETTWPERESRPYSSDPPSDHRQRSINRLTFKRSISNLETVDPPYRHQQGECWVCDSFDYHTLPPLPSSDGSNAHSVPQSPLMTSCPPPNQQEPVSANLNWAPTSQPRSVRSQSHKGARPMNFYAGMLPEYNPYFSQPASTPDWNIPLTPMSPYPQTPFMPKLTTTTPGLYDYPQSFTLPNDQRLLAPPKSKRPEPSPTATSRGEPIIEQAIVPRNKPSLSRTTSQKRSQHSREPSKSREEDAKKMPPSEIIPVARRPSIIKANTSSSTQVSSFRERRNSSYGSVSGRSPQKERRPEMPPSSFHVLPSAYQNSSYDKPANRQSKIYDESKHTTKVNPAAPSLDRRATISNSECHEVEAEAYQQSRGTKSQPLTADSVPKLSRNSDNDSQRSGKSSSKCSSGGKTKAATNDITMIIKGVTVGISGESAEKHSIRIQPKSIARTTSSLSITTLSEKYEADHSLSDGHIGDFLNENGAENEGEPEDEACHDPGYYTDAGNDSGTNDDRVDDAQVDHESGSDLENAITASELLDNGAAIAAPEHGPIREETITIPKASPKPIKVSAASSGKTWSNRAWGAVYDLKELSRVIAIPSFLPIQLREIGSFPSKFRHLFGEPPLEAGKVRVKWTCRCGQRLYDDFRESRPGAAEDFAKSLNHSDKWRTDGLGVFTQSISRFFRRAIVEAGSSKTDTHLESTATSSNQSLPDQSASQKIVQHSSPQNLELRVQSKNRNTVPAQTVNPATRFLLTCIPTDKYAISLLQLSLEHPHPIVSDRQLLSLLHTKYNSIRSNWPRRLLSFSTLSSIEFVQFELHRRSLVDIRKRADIPPSSRRDEYDYRPLPAEIIPPVGRNYLMHIYHHPEDADSETVCLNRFPKRMRETLELGGSEQACVANVQVGWGMEFVEGVYWNKVWWAGFGIIVLSFVMGLVWSTVKRDVQGGFGIAAYMMAFLTFTVGMVQTVSQ